MSQRASNELGTPGAGNEPGSQQGVREAVMSLRASNEPGTL